MNVKTAKYLQMFAIVSMGIGAALAGEMNSSTPMVDETQNVGGPHRCTSDDHCTGSRICSPHGWCMDSPSAPSPEAVQQDQAPSIDQATLNAMPRIIDLVKSKKDDACNTVKHMEETSKKQPGLQSNEGFIRRFNNWKQICERREGILNVFVHGTEKEQLDTIKRISSDPEVMSIIEDEKRKLEASGTPESIDPWDAPL